MITVLTGGNSFEVRQVIDTYRQAFDGTPERFDGSSLQLAQLPDLLMGVSLFAEKRLVIIDQLSQSTAVWQKLPEWLPRVSDTIQLVLVEPTLDKRTSTYKALKKMVEIQEFPAWTDKDTARAEAWTQHYATDHGVNLTRPLAAHLVGRVGVDQWGLSQAVHVLSLLEEGTSLTESVIDEVIVASPEDNVFRLLDYALDGNARAAVDFMHSLELTEEPHMLMALVIGQVYALTATVLAPSDADPAKDFAVHPYVVSKLRRFKQSLGVAGVLSMIQSCAQADTDLKSSKAEPWVLLERLIVKLAHRTAA